jgi:hypothetical protein
VCSAHDRLHLLLLTFALAAEEPVGKALRVVQSAMNPRQPQRRGTQHGT